MKYGYARVSTDDQNADMQHAALKKAGCTKIFTDNGLSGRDDQAPCPAPLPQDARTWRQLDGVEARPARPQLARPDNHARRPANSAA